MKTEPVPAGHPAPARAPLIVQLAQHEPAAIRDELQRGLLAPAARVAPKFLYDALGSRLFEAICELPEYYPTRTEAAIFAQASADIAQAVGPIGTLVDLGAGNCAKAARLFPVLAPDRYLAIDISVDFLRDALAALQLAHPTLEIAGLGLDFSKALALPADAISGRPVFFYPGSSLGNFHPDEALRFLRDVREHAGGGGLLIGIDLVKPAATLEPAYDDALGVTAAFNLNLLRHLNRLLGADFEPREWRHVARFDPTASRIEMYLEARHALRIAWPGGERRFAGGERIHTENSYKYEPHAFRAMVADAGFRSARHWVDERGWFAVFWADAA